ncbi:hypothetical protein ACFWRG_32085 [Micromonospora tulbaghiae]|uniref:Uncharacterized protein n=2 Tax=Streptomyces TaxID=1883 RepID=A0A1E7LWF5_9ACTN|nr:hypothetical protein [Streptomyces nanshensis]OEV20223.1 hypothetical protein AN221_13560 [Streptomyces nanshensis]
MKPDRNYATARQLIDPDADYTVHIRTDAGWTRPTNPDHQELPGLDVLLAARRALRAQPAGHVESTSPGTLDVRTHDDQLWLRFTDSTLRGNEPDPAKTSPGARPTDGLWRLLGLSGSALVPLSRSDLTDSDLVTLARTCLVLNHTHPQTDVPPQAGLLLERLATTVEALDAGLPGAPDIDEDLSRAELLTIAETALALYQTHGDPDDLLGRPEVLLLAHLAYDTTA